jgi:hypothetical protein
MPTPHSMNNPTAEHSFADYFEVSRASTGSFPDGEEPTPLDSAHASLVAHGRAAEADAVAALEKSHEELLDLLVEVYSDVLTARGTLPVRSAARDAINERIDRIKILISGRPQKP